MQGVNKVIVLGNLGKDPEVRFLESGSAVCTLRLACTERRKDGDNWKDHTEWLDVVTFGRTAENAGQYLSKGKQVYVEGRLQTREYEKDGEKRWRTEVIAQQVIFLGGGNGDGAKRAGSGSTNGAGAKPSAGQRSEGEPGPASDDGFINDDLPF